MDNSLKQLANNMGVQIVNLNLQMVDLQSQLKDALKKLKDEEQKNTELKTQLKTLRKGNIPKNNA